MSNFLEDGTVLPFGLLGHTGANDMAGFNKTYRNTSLRMGVVVATYAVTDEKNRTKLATEYDVTCIEQFEDKGATTIAYKNCMAMEALGSIADFFEKTYRQRDKKDYKSDAVRLNQQDGSVVLILCLDGASDKAIILGGFSHPDRPTTLKTKDPRLEGEYNGINIKVETDGSAVFTFKGATKNDGSLVNPSQTPTEAKVEADGSFQVDHKTVTFRLDASGVATLTSKGDTVINCQNANVNAKGDATVTAAGTATVEGKDVKLGAGAAEAVIKGDTFKKMVYDVHIHPTPIGPSGPPTKPMSPDSLSKKVKTE